MSFGLSLTCPSILLLFYPLLSAIGVTPMPYNDFRELGLYILNLLIFATVFRSRIVDFKEFRRFSLLIVTVYQIEILLNTLI
jgi:hypothetical protein